MHLPWAEAADRGILLSFLVKAYAKTQLLPESRRTQPFGTGRRRKKPSEYSESGPGNGNAHSHFLHRHGDTSGHFCPCSWETVLRGTSLSEDTLPGEDI